MALEHLQSLPGCVRPPSAGGQFGPIRSGPTEAGRTTSTNFILLILNSTFPSCSLAFPKGKGNNLS